MLIKRLDKYTPEVAARFRKLMIDFSRSHKDRGEIPREWFEDVINSPWHDIIIAEDESNIVIGIAVMSTIMSPDYRKIAYLEGFITDPNVRGKGIGSAIWNEIITWGKEKGCARLEFTCGHGREVAQQFYKNHGAEIYDTNFFRKDIS